MDDAKGNNILNIVFAGIIIAVAIVLIIVSKYIFVVTFDSNGGSNVDSQLILYNHKIIEPEVPTVSGDGLIFDGWYSGDELWNFDEYTVTQNITLTAKWTWNGETASYEWFDNYNYDETTNYYIDNGAELNALALLVRGETNKNILGAVDFLGKTITLTNDINLGGNEWTPIGTENISFKGNFDGQNHIISGLTITDENTSLTGWDAGLFGFVSGTSGELAEIKNFSITDVNINLTNKEKGYTGSAVSAWLKDAKVTNVSATGKINIESDASTVAGLFLVNDGKIIMEDVINNVEISGTRYNSSTSVSAYFILGGIVGQTAGDGPCYYKNCINNVNLIMNNPFNDDLTSYIGNYTPKTIAGHILRSSIRYNRNKNNI